MLNFADHLKKENKNTSLINRMLLAVRYYFTWLQSEEKMSYNPAAGISLKGAIRHLPNGLLEKAELGALYNNYEIKDGRTHRNKVILGLRECNANCVSFKINVSQKFLFS